jgi:hypothetical protein
MIRKEPENRIPVKHQARGFMVGPAGFMMEQRIHRACFTIKTPSDGRKRQSTSSEGSWFPRGGFMVATELPSLLARRPLN